MTSWITLTSFNADAETSGALEPIAILVIPNGVGKAFPGARDRAWLG